MEPRRGNPVTGPRRRTWQMICSPRWRPRARPGRSPRASGGSRARSMCTSGSPPPPLAPASSPHELEFAVPRSSSTNAMRRGRRGRPRERASTIRPRRLLRSRATTVPAGWQPSHVRASTSGWRVNCSPTAPPVLSVPESARAVVLRDAQGNQLRRASHASRGADDRSALTEPRTRQARSAQGPPT